MDAHARAAQKHDEAAQIAKAAAENSTPGDPLDPSTTLGPLVSAAQRDRVRNYIKRASTKARRSSPAAPSRRTGSRKGYFVRPTVFANVTQRDDHRAGRDLRPRAVHHPLRRRRRSGAHRQRHDLRARGRRLVGDPERAPSVARRLRTGQVDINGGNFNPQAPFGGYKQSGNGRELGKYGLEEFLKSSRCSSDVFATSREQGAVLRG